MTCDPQSLIAAAKCFQCLTRLQLEQAKVYLYGQVAGWIPGPAPSFKGILGEGGEYILDEAGHRIYPEN